MIKGIVFFFPAGMDVGHSFIQIRKSCFFFPRSGKNREKKHKLVFFSQEKFIGHSFGFLTDSYFLIKVGCVFFFPGFFRFAGKKNTILDFNEWMTNVHARGKKKYDTFGGGTYLETHGTVKFPSYSCKILLPLYAKHKELMQTFTNSQKFGAGAFDTKFTLYSWFMLNFTSFFYKQKTFIQNVRKNGGGILYQKVLIIHTKILFEVENYLESCKKRGVSSIQNPLVIATKILEV